MSVYNTVTKFETFDMKEFDSAHQAEEHVHNELCELFAAKLKPIIKDIGQATLYKVICALVSDNIDEAIALCKAQAEILGLDVSEKWED
jgi:hypothetical protein